MNCPICNTVVDDTYKTPFCPTCHWELAVVPVNISPDMRKYFMERQRAFRDRYLSVKEKQTLEREIEAITNDIISLNEKITEANSLLHDKEQIMERMRSVPAELETTRQSIQSIQEEITRLRVLATQSHSYQGDLETLKIAYRQVLHLGCNEQVKIVEEFLRKKGIIK